MPCMFSCVRRRALCIDYSSLVETTLCSDPGVEKRCLFYPTLSCGSRPKREKGVGGKKKKFSPCRTWGQSKVSRGGGKKKKKKSMRTHRWIFWHCLRAASLSYLFKDSGIDRSRYWARIRSRDVRPNWMPHVWKGAFHVYRTRGELLLRCRNRNIMKWNVWWRFFFASNAFEQVCTLCV